ncbi:unnamed protein product [Strongylus vulgaris]|uniref:glutaminase n=1 Tax=Strongylus vulgaris TaxID=40348 RepID=A0A3P7JL40_STRVU|nr:unnamed protein product [Strongylus vulgaris]
MNYSLMRENTVHAGLLFGRSLSYDISYRTHIQDLIFDLYRDQQTNKIYIPRFFKELIDVGIRKDDPRLEEMIKQVREAEHVDQGIFDQEHLYLDKEAFNNVKYSTRITVDFRCAGSSIGVIGKALKKQLVIPDWCAGSSIGVIGKALKKQLVIPDWSSFTGVMGELFEGCRNYRGGQPHTFRNWQELTRNPTYIPQLARADPESFAVSVCTVDGQRKSWGDALKPFCLQSVSKPFTYALVHDEIGPDELHNHVGQEPSGRLFNDISLDHNKKPHNPLINAGAIVVASLMKRRASLSDRFDFVRFTSDSPNKKVLWGRLHTLDLYFQLCSIETNCDTLAVMAATLANGGVNPMNGERVINNR